MRFFLLVLLLGIISYTHSIGWHVPYYVIDSNVDVDRKPDGLRHKFDEKIADLWDEHTLVSAANDEASFDTEIDGEVNTISGKTMLTNLDQRLVYAYQGFRYGKEPNKDTKFRPPVAEDFKFWEGTEFDATHIGFKCPQNAMIGGTVAGRKDCLYLNVYTPYLPQSATMQRRGPLAVMFFIHGGAFIMGDTSMYLPTKLLEHDVILVTIHYRLGAQGFLTLNNANAPGNTALYDMVEALKWVQANIKIFGGNPERVTIFGESAGSVAVNYLMISPVAEGLFSNVIADSGSSIDNWSIDIDPSYAANSIMAFVGCDQEDEDTNFQCLLDVSEEDMVYAENDLIKTDRVNGLNGFRGAAPTLQRNKIFIGGVDPFITELPLVTLSTFNYKAVPFMTGSNRDEGSYVAGIMFETYLLPNNYENDTVWLSEVMVQNILLSAGIVDDTRAIEESLTNYYCQDIDVSNMTASSYCMIDMIGAIFLKAGSWAVSNYHSRHPNFTDGSSTYYYSFEYESDDTMYLWLMGNVPWDTGITHSDELMYLFSMPATMEDEQIITERRMTLMWTNFARFGNPTPAEEETTWSDMFEIPQWTPFGENDPHFMIINHNWTVETEFSDRWALDANREIINPVTDFPVSSLVTDNISWVTDNSSWVTDNSSWVTGNSSWVTDNSSRSSGTTDDSFWGTTPATEMTYTQEEWDDIKHERDAYLATMIVFIILFVVALGGCIFLIVK